MDFQYAFIRLPPCLDMSKSRIAEQSVGSETYGFDAIRGTQAKREFYVAMCPLKIIPKLFIFNDYEIISELTTFISKHNSFEAEEGCNDDLAMCLVIYAWLVAQDYFKELTDQDVRKRLYEEQKNQIEQDMAPFGFINDGLDDTSFVD